MLAGCRSARRAPWRPNRSRVLAGARSWSWIMPPAVRFPRRTGSPGRSAHHLPAGNGGFAVGVNAGWRAADSRWLLVLNPDVEVTNGFLERGLRPTPSLRGRSERPAGDRGVRIKNPDGSPRGRWRLPVPGPLDLGAVLTALPPEIPARLANPHGARRLGHGRLHARERRPDRRPRRDGRGFLPVSRRSRILPASRGGEVGGWSSIRA